MFENEGFNQFFVRVCCEGKSGQFRENIGYYQKKSGAEIDFILEGKTALEVKIKGGGFDVKKLERTISKLGITSCRVVSLDRINKQSEKVIYPYDLGVPL